MTRKITNQTELCQNTDTLLWRSDDCMQSIHLTANHGIDIGYGGSHWVMPAKDWIASAEALASEKERSRVEGIDEAIRAIPNKMLNKYQIGDNVEYQIEGKTYQGKVYEIKAQTKRYNGKPRGENGYSVILEDQPIGYKVLGTSFRIRERDIIKKL